MMRGNRALAAAAALLAMTGTASAQDTDFVDAQEVQKQAEEKVAGEEGEKAPDGWTYKLSLGSNFALTHNRSWVGNPDGAAVQIGIVLDGSAKLLSGQHEWLTELAIKHTQARSPEIGKFVKTLDDFVLRTTYLYKLESLPWMGPYARARMQTGLFPGNFIDATDRTLVLPDGTEENVSAKEKFQLTSAFEPLLLRESAGLFARPYEAADLVFTATLGAGAQEIFTQGGYSIADPEADPLVLVELIDSTQIGTELELEAKGEATKLFTYSLRANLLQPFYTSVDTGDLSGLDLLNTELEVKMSFKLNQWASMDYVFLAKKIPLVVDAWQVQNGLLVSAAFSIL
jgi:hypothetical protein